MAAKRKVLPLAEKLYIINEVDNNPNVKKRDIAKRFGLSPSTLNTILSKRKAITEAANKCGLSSIKRKNAKDSPLANLEHCLLVWLGQAKTKNAPVTGPILKETAKVMAKRLGIKKFQASNGWISNFKSRHGISYNTTTTETTAMAEETDQLILNQWRVETLPQQLQGYAPRDIFNADEIGLFFTLLPEKAAKVRGDKCQTGSKSKCRITILLCCNADGSDKLEPLVIGRAKRPVALRNVPNPPCKYANHDKAWIDSRLFGQFLREFDALMGSQSRNVILFVNRCAAHLLDFEPKNVKVGFFPSDCGNDVQPLRNGITARFKHCYRSKIVQRLATMLDCGVCDSADIKIDISTAMNFVAASWTDIGPSTITNCFAKAGFDVKPNVLSESDCRSVLQDDWVRMSFRDFEDFVSCDDGLETCGGNSESCDAGSDDGDYCESVGPPRTVPEARPGSDTLRKFAVSAHGGADLLVHVHRAENIVQQTQPESTQQTASDEIVSIE